jgi:ribonuclease HI
MTNLGHALINPGGEGLTNTINRAELAAIAVALTNGHRRIATDSQASIDQIHRAVWDPDSLRTHLHRDLLDTIVRHIARSPEPVQLYKVKAHSRILGNEVADMLAKRAARHPDICDMGLHHSIPFADLVWLEVQPEAPAAAGPMNAEQLHDMGPALRAHMDSQHRFGKSNRDSTYFQSWQATATIAAPGSLAQVMTDPLITHQQRRLALKYRVGNLHNQKLAHRFGKALTPNCPVCGRLDSANHVLSGPCSAQHQAGVTERHNGAVRLIAKAISKSSRGADLCFVDAGSEDKANAEGLTFAGRNRQQWLALKAKLLASNTTSRPDILLVEGGAHASATAEITAIEIKYCPDTSPAAQLVRAQAQHQNLRTRIDGRTVQVIPILLGIVGTTYSQHTLTALLGLGISRRNATKLLTKLTRHALRHAVLLASSSYAARRQCQSALATG